MKRSLDFFRAICVVVAVAVHITLDFDLVFIIVL